MRQTYIRRMNRLLLFIPVLLFACGQPEPVFNDELDVRAALESVQNAQFTASLSSKTEASGSEWNRVVTMDWMRGHAVEDSTFGMAWTLSDTFMDEGDTSLSWMHLWAHELTQIGGDSLIKRDNVDPGSHRNGNGIPNYYTSMALPKMLSDTSWWADQVSDSLVQVVWEHILPNGSQPEQFIVTSSDIQDPADEDYHPDTRSVQRWVFEAPQGLPVRHEQSWYRGDMAYGSDIVLEWSWNMVNDESVAASIRDWAVPSWAKEPAPTESEVAGGGDGNWLEEAMAALPAIDAMAPPLEGTDLSGAPLALADLQGNLVYVDFWYIGCGPCMRALPHLAHMQERFGPSGFKVLGVNHHQEAKTIQRYLDRRELDIPQLLMDSLPEGYPVVGYPTWFLIGRDGNVIDRNIGYGEDTGAFLDSLVGANLQ